MHLHWSEPSEFPTLSADEVHVWAVPLDQPRASSMELERALSPDERVRADDFALDKPRHAFTASRAALRTLLGRYLGLSPNTVPIAIDPHGKLRLAAGDLCFNLAHSAELTLIAVTRGCEVGVDLERVRPVRHAYEIAARNFHPSEQAAIRTADATELPAAFMRIWTRKEAVLKAVGSGLRYPLGAFETLTQATVGSWLHLPGQAASLPAVRCWLQNVHPSDNYLAALATLQRRPLPLGFTYSL